MKATIISYNLSKSDINQRTSIHRVLYGYKDHSNKGAYIYNRKGLIKKIRCLKINRGVIITKDKDKNVILSVLRKNKATVKTVPIDIGASLVK